MIAKGALFLRLPLGAAVIVRKGRLHCQARADAGVSGCMMDPSNNAGIILSEGLPV